MEEIIEEKRKWAPDLCQYCLILKCRCFLNVATQQYLVPCKINWGQQDQAIVHISYQHPASKDKPKYGKAQPPASYKQNS